VATSVGINAVAIATAANATTGRIANVHNATFLKLYLFDLILIISPYFIYV
jgi:hypothetical protein